MLKMMRARNCALLSPAIGSTGIPLRNWLVTFEEPVVASVASTPSTPNALLDKSSNPAHASLQVRSKDSAKTIANITLLDLSGREVQCGNDAGKAELTLDVEDLAPGLYMLGIKLHGGIVVVSNAVLQ